MTKIAIIGGGPGGYVAAIRAAQLGADVTLIEGNNIGGTCLNVGCIPTKSLLETARIYNESKKAEEFGVKISKSQVDLALAQSRKNQVINQLVSGVEGLLRANKVKVIQGFGEFKDSKTIVVKDKNNKRQEVVADRIIIATGSKPAIPPIEGVELDYCMTSTEALDLKEVPESLTIIGGGVIGIELASIYNSFGTKVKVVEMLPEILGRMDKDIVKLLRAKLEEEGIEFYTSSQVLSIEDIGQRAKVVVENSNGVINLESDKVLLSVGRELNTKKLNLDRIGLETERGKILVDEKMQTNVPGIFAIGDCTGGAMLAHVASRQGEIAAENALGRVNIYRDRTNPACVYTSPEIASVGYTEEELKEKNIEYKVGKFPLAANGKSLIVGEDGIVKILAGKKYGEVLGLHIIGPRATDLIAEGSLAIELEATLDELIDTIHGHPTVNESIREAALLAENRPIHII